MADCLPLMCRLTHRYRGQARSHRRLSAATIKLIDT